MPRAVVNGIDTYYEVHGDGVPLLACHGSFGGIARALLAEGRAAPTTFGDDVRLVHYDRRSSGRSQYVLEDFTLDDLTADAAALLDHLDIERAIVTGTSAGGPLALNFALTHPERTLALVLVCTSSALMCTRPYGDDASRVTPEIEARMQEVGRRLHLVRRAREIGDRAQFERVKERLRNPRPTVTTSEAAAGRDRDLQDRIAAATDEELFTYFTGEVRQMGAYEEVDLTSRLGEIRVPTLVVHGTADERVPVQLGRDLAANIAGAELHEIEGARHSVSEDPRARQVIQSWLAGVSTSMAAAG